MTVERNCEKLSKKSVRSQKSYTRSHHRHMLSEESMTDSSGHLQPGYPSGGHLGSQSSGLQPGCHSSSHLLPGNHVSHNRAGSFKVAGELRSRQTAPDTHLAKDDSSRRGSVTSGAQPSYLSVSFDDVRDGRENKDASIRRVRSFKTTSKGVVNRGDSFRKKGGRNSGSTNITHSRDNVGHGGGSTRPFPLMTPRVATQTSISGNASYFKVLVLGATGVGKSSITQQFMTSEYVAFDNSIDRDEEENTVSVLLNGEESTLECTDGLDPEYDLEDFRVDAYIVVFSIAHRDTFDAATDILNELLYDIGTDRTIILVGNKADLVRKRKVSTEEALSIALQYDAKYTETSAALNHHVDELLVGMLSQIRFKLNPTLPEPVLAVESKKSSISRMSFKGPFDLLSRLFGRGSRKAGKRSYNKTSQR
ncbi:uncharacterized protein LOC117337543 [Pecten maximus]|uniref:uncharacterized protein LOC117337543 n=1 Tax=Pecten maximus TaxID=6579 RepID=UPI001457F8B2|nr:uncharacterized protein LOC117337543 [Pecten maximus]